MPQNILDFKPNLKEVAQIAVCPVPSAPAFAREFDITAEARDDSLALFSWREAFAFMLAHACRRAGASKEVIENVVRFARVGRIAERAAADIWIVAAGTETYFVPGKDIPAVKGHGTILMLSLAVLWPTFLSRLRDVANRKVVRRRVAAAN